MNAQNSHVMCEHLLGGGGGYLPAIYIYGQHARLAIEAKKQRTKLTESRGKGRLISAEWHDLTPVEWRIKQGDIHLMNMPAGREPFSFWIDEREAQALLDVQRDKTTRCLEIPPDGTYWGARVIKISGLSSRAKKQGTPLHLQRRDTSIDVN